MGAAVGGKCERVATEPGTTSAAGLADSLPQALRVQGSPSRPVPSAAPCSPTLAAAARAGPLGDETSADPSLSRSLDHKGACCSTAPTSAEGGAPHLAPGGALSHSLNNLQRLFTPPVIPPGMAMGARGLSLSHATPPRALVATRKGSKSAAGSAERPAEGTGPGGDDEREELDLLYDGILNCYYDPRTNKYYELA